MSTPARITAFPRGLVVVFVLSFAVGRAVGPTAGPPPPLGGGHPTTTPTTPSPTVNAHDTGDHGG